MKNWIKLESDQNFNIMDNKVSTQVYHFITNTLVLYQKVAPHCQWANAAKKPYKQPNTIVLQALHPPTHISPSTNGMIFPHRQNSHLICLDQQGLAPKYQLLWTQLQCCPPGTSRLEVLYFDDLAEHQTWAPCGMEGFYIASAPDNFCCYKFYIQATGRTHISNTTVFYPPATCQQLTLPTPKKIRKALTEVAQNNSLYDSLSTFEGLQQLADICGNKLPRLSDSNKTSHPISNVFPPMMTKQHSNHLPLHWYPTMNKMLHTLYTTNYNYLPAYLMDTIDQTDPSICQCHHLPHNR